MEAQIKGQISLFDTEKEEAKPLGWKYDTELGIVYFCNNCGKVSCAGNRCEECGQKLNRENHVHNEKIKIIW